MNTLFSNVTVVSMDEQRRILRNAFVSVEGHSIQAVSETRPEGSFDREIDGTGKVLMPGLVNAHTHVPMSLLRGYGGGHDLQTWLNDYIFPAEDRLDGRCVRCGTALSAAELIANGVTCLADMYYFLEDMAETILESGLNANLARGTTCFQKLTDVENYQSVVDLRDMVERYHGRNDGQILVDASIHGEYTSYAEPGLWEYLGRYAADHGLGMHVHISETRSEHEECISRHRTTPLRVLDSYGVWECGRSIAAHCVWCSEGDFALMREKNITCVHNPVSNLKLGSGVARVPDMLRSGVNVALGTDGVSSNNHQDLFEEVKLSSILHCGLARDPQAVTALQALEMATVNGGRALGRRCGSVRPGWDADLILLDFTRPGLVPCHDVVENLVYSARGSDVCLTMARGKILYENGTFLTLDMEKIRWEVEHYALPHMFG
jgi:5-methylthioadenosine/S-adenosylhomocysteine deaminase